ncbi:hypothetical protein M3Y97_00580100 [Aphelenchoides bicaudatus]|nr:hypothetical protein M3Y97_00580100 [Aphelenchoides bicaudatus]
MDPIVKKELIDGINKLDIKQEEAFDYIIMANCVGIESSANFYDNCTITVNQSQVEVDFGSATLIYQHADGQKRYRLMHFRQAPRFKIKLLDVRQVLNDSIVGTGNLVMSFENEDQLSIFQEQLENAGYSPDF